MVTGTRLPPDWEVLYTNTGRSYFWNRRTNQTTWQFPQEVEVAPRSQTEEAAPSGYLAKPTSRKDRRFSEDGRCFMVECMPADHSCGFHGIGVERQTAAALLMANLQDPQVEEFLGRDLLAALQTSSQRSFPPKLREIHELWEMLQQFYQQQEALDKQRREVKEFMMDAGASSAVQALASQGIEVAIKGFFLELKEKVKQTTSKLFLLQLLASCKAQERELQAANERSKEALQALRDLCKKHVAAYVAWVGSDSTFWLSFIRGAEGDSGGGLLDAVAKVACLTVRVWGEGPSGRLTLLHMAPFGGRDVDLWYRDLNHYDRLVPCSPR